MSTYSPTLAGVATGHVDSAACGRHLAGLSEPFQRDGWRGAIPLVGDPTLVALSKDTETARLLPAVHAAEELGWP